MKHRVVITGMGVVAPNGVGIPQFTEALKNGTSGISFHPQLKELNFSCQIGGIPHITEELKSDYFTELQLRGFNSSGILYGCIAGVDAWKDAGLEVHPESELDYGSGLIFGTGTSGVDNLGRPFTNWMTETLGDWAAPWCCRPWAVVLVLIWAVC